MTPTPAEQGTEYGADPLAHLDVQKPGIEERVQMLPSRRHAAARIGRQQGIATLAQVKQGCAPLSKIEMSPSVNRVVQRTRL